jgi:hypothetical protein
MWIGKRRVIQRPGIRCNADEQLSLAATAALIPCSLIRGKITNSWRAACRPIGECPPPCTRSSVERRSGAGLRGLSDVLGIKITVCYQALRVVGNELCANGRRTIFELVHWIERLIDGSRNSCRRQNRTQVSLCRERAAIAAYDECTLSSSRLV